VTDAGGWREYGETVCAERLVVVVRSTETWPRRTVPVDGEVEVSTGREKRGSLSIP